MQSRILSALTVVLVGLGWWSWPHTARMAWAAAQWPWLLPVLVAWLLVVWGTTSPIWSGLHTLLVFILAAHVAFSTRHPGLFLMTTIVLAAAAIAAGWGRRVLQMRERTAQTACEAAEEQVNTLQDTAAHLDAVTRALSVRLRRYVTLREVTEALSRHPEDLDALLATVVDQAMRVLDHADVALVYQVEMPRHEMALRAARWRGDSTQAIKQKTGDLFDDWVLRQGQPLLVRDVTRDFRFPRDAAAQDQRPLGALIAAPLVSAQRVLGVLRAESAEAGAFSSEDLRLLDIVADLTAMAIENTRLYLRTAELAITDDLTGLAVRRYFQERFEEELSRARRYHSPVSVLLIDLDHFKRYNDTYGHPAGDKLLRTIAQTLRRLQGPGELIARYGGEEFVMLLHGIGRAEAHQRAEALRASLAAQPIVLRQGSAAITVSIGVAAFPDDGPHKENILQAADQRLYRAKQQGRNQVCGA